MDIFTQKKILVRIVIVLALLNLVSIGVFLWKAVTPPPRPASETEATAPPRDVSAILEKELNLSREQVDQIKNLRADFAEKEKSLVEAIQRERDSMNQEMFNAKTNEEVIRSLAGKIAENEYKMEMLRYDQSLQLKAICTPQQVEQFEKLVRDMRDFFKPDNKPGRQPRKGPPRKRDE
jgi:Spy/CpxP family protein refolding chaperone